MLEILTIQITDGHTLIQTNYENLHKTLEDLEIDPNYEVICVLKDKVQLKDEKVKQIINKKNKEIKFETHVANEAITREKLVELIRDRKEFETGYSDVTGIKSEECMLHRYAIQMFYKNICVTTRIKINEYDEVFDIVIVVQKDNYFEEDEFNENHDYFEGDWEDDKWINYISGNLNVVGVVITDEVYNNLFKEMEKIIRHEMSIL